MNARRIAFAVALLFVSMGSAQEDSAVEPEYFSVFYYLESSGQLTELERQIPAEVFRSSKVVFVIQGEKSKVRFKGDAKLLFAVRVTEDLDKAKATMQLFRFEGRNGTRELEGKIKQKVFAAPSLALNTERYGRSSAKITPVKKLMPGEYCLTRNNIPQGFCFGVDALGN
jgi:hypothetical protein